MKVLKKRILLLLFVLAASLILASCASNGRKAKLNEPDLYWPGNPEPPRLKYLYSFQRPEDLDIGNSFFSKFKNFVFGKSLGDVLLKPYSIHADPEGRILVTDTGSNSVHVFNTEKNKYFRIPKGVNERLGLPIAAVSGKDGIIYVSDSKNGRVNIYDKSGDLISFFNAGLVRPTGLAVNFNDNLLYVVDTAQHKIMVYDLEGKPANFFGGRGKGDIQFNFPTNIFIDQQELIYITDSMNFRIQVLNRDGEFVTSFGHLGDGAGDFSSPKGVAADSEGNIYVVDTLFDNFQIFDIKGKYLLPVGTQGSDRGQFWLPTGIFVDSRDRIYVADAYNARVQVFQFLGSTEGSPIEKKK